MDPELDEDSDEDSDVLDDGSEELDSEEEDSDELDSDDGDSEEDDSEEEDSEELESDEPDEAEQECKLTSRFHASQVQARLESHAPGRGITVMFPASSNWGWITPVGEHMAAVRSRRSVALRGRRVENLTAVALMLIGKLFRARLGVNHRAEYFQQPALMRSPPDSRYPTRTAWLRPTPFRLALSHWHHSSQPRRRSGPPPPLPSPAGRGSG